MNQSEQPINHLIERFSDVGDLVLDPMAGSGTVARVSKDMKRRCIAIDKDRECVKIIKGRLNK